MLAFLILILCINIDALSYGVASGASGKRFSIWYISLVCFMSTIMFAVPLILSKYVFSYFNEIVCNIINGIFLIILGICFMIPHKNKPNTSDKTTEKELNNKKQKQNGVSFPKCFCECFIISVDAIFSAFLSNFNMPHYFFYVAFYAITNFLAILIGNRILYKVNTKSKINLNFISAIIFIVLGGLKCFGI